MKYCYACGHTTGGEPLFCNSCGCSYDVKLCPKLHLNPRFAEACSQCGSRDLSTPQPRVPWRWRLLAFLAQFLSGILLGLLTLSVLSGLRKDLLSNSEIHPSQAILILLSIALWSIWLLVVPRLFRKAIYLSIRHSQDIYKSR
jgi:hypothetical protein